MKRRMFRIVLIIATLMSVSCKRQESAKPVTQTNEPPIQQMVTNIIEVSTPDTKSARELYLDSLGLMEIKKICPDIIIDLKYSTTDNFTGKILYQDLKTAYLHPLAANKLSRALELLKKEHPHLNLLVYDAARPLSVQKAMYNAVKDTKYRAYVANPSRTSLHNYGLAVDITICDSTGVALDMGTDFDYFGKLAGILREEEFVSQNLLSHNQVNNRRLLRSIMQEAGFSPIRGEWWHFNATSLSEAQNKHPLIK